MADVKDVAEFKASGCNEAFTRIYNRWDSVLRNASAHRYIINPSDLDDFMQDFWLRVYTYLDSFEGRSSLNTWLHRVLYNHGMDYQRAHLRQRWAEGLDLNTEEGDYSDLDVLGGERGTQTDMQDTSNTLTDFDLELLGEAFEKAAKRIPEKIRGPWEMSHAGLSYDEMLELTGYAYKTLREYTYQGNFILKQEIRDVAQKAVDNSTHD